MKKEIKAYIDRIESDIAVIYLGDDESCKIDVPIKFLPENIKEDTKIKISFNVDEKAKKDNAEEIEALRKKLINNS